MFLSYLLNKIVEFFIKFFYCFICVVGIVIFFVRKLISMFICGVVFLGVIMLLIFENVIWNY